MRIITIPYEENIYIQIGDQKIKIVTFATQEPGNIKFGIDAPKNIKVHREEVYQIIQSKNQKNETID